MKIKEVKQLYLWGVGSRSYSAFAYTSLQDVYDDIKRFMETTDIYEGKLPSYSSISRKFSDLISDTVRIPIKINLDQNLEVDLWIARFSDPVGYSVIKSSDYLDLIDKVA